MTTLQEIKDHTSILTMACERVYQLTAYEAECEYRAAQVKAGLITVEEAIKLIRNS